MVSNININPTQEGVVNLSFDTVEKRQGQYILHKFRFSKKDEPVEVGLNQVLKHFSKFGKAYNTLKSDEDVAELSRRDSMRGINR